MNDEQKQRTLQIKNYEAHRYLLKMLYLTRWISSVLQITTEVNNFTEFAEWLRDGIVLCQLVNQLKPGVIKEYHSDRSTSSKTKALENLLCFLYSLLQFEIPRDHRFGPLDLFEEKNLNKVVDCLEELAQKENFTMDQFFSQGLDDTKIQATLSPKNLKKTIKMLIENESQTSSRASKNLSNLRTQSTHEDALLVKEQAEKDLNLSSKGSHTKIVEIDAPTLSTLLPLLDQVNLPEDFDDDDEEEEEYDRLQSSHQTPLPVQPNKKEMALWSDNSPESSPRVIADLASEETDPSSSDDSSFESPSPITTPCDQKNGDTDEPPPKEEMKDFMNFLYGGKQADGVDSPKETQEPTITLPSNEASSINTGGDSTSSSSNLLPTSHTQTKGRLSVSLLTSPVEATKTESKSLSPRNETTTTTSGNTSETLVPPTTLMADAPRVPSMYNHSAYKFAAMRPSISVPKGYNSPGHLDTNVPSVSIEMSVSQPDLPMAHAQSAITVALDPEVESFLRSRSEVSVNFARMNPKKMQRSRDGFTGDMILPGVYLGDKKSAYNLAALQERNITHVISMIGDTPFESKIEYMIQNINDAVDQEIMSIFPATNAFIAKAREHGGVLVHCQKGVSRSAAVIIAYLMYSQQLSFYDASDFVCLKRAIVCPNLGFIEQLKQYEALIRPKPPSLLAPNSGQKDEHRKERRLSQSSINTQSSHDVEKSRFKNLKQLIHAPKIKRPGDKKSHKPSSLENSSNH